MGEDPRRDLEERARLTLEERARLTLELIDLGIKIMRQNLKRRFPDEPDLAIEGRLTEWLRTRPGAEDGDAWGRASQADPDAILARVREGA